MSRTAQFQIGAGDAQRAIGFYRSVFGWSFRSNGESPADSWLISAGPEGASPIHGGLSTRQPAGGYISTMAVTSIDDCSARVRAHGGQVIAAKVEVPGVGFLAYCKDTEENLFGIMEFARVNGAIGQTRAA